jgi:hypothetical protein
MTAPTLSRRSLYPAAFLLALITVYAGDLLAAAAFGRSAHPDLLALGITLDLVVIVPSLVYFLLVRDGAGRRWW